MSSESRDEILANFQTVTGIDDFEKAIKLLDQNEWDFQKAISEFTDSITNSSECSTKPNMPRTRSVATAEKSSFAKARCAREKDSEKEGESSNFAGSSSNRSSSPAAPNGPSKLHHKRRHDGLPVNSDSHEASTSYNHSPSLAKLTVKHESNSFFLFVSPSITIGKIKDLLFEETNIPVPYQILSGWTKEPTSEQSTLDESSSIDPTDNSFHLSLKRKDLNDRALKKVYTLKVSDEKGKNFTLQLPGSHRVAMVKKHVAKLFDIPVTKQVWEGWPSNVTDEKYIGHAGLKEPVHHFRVKIVCDSIEIIDLVSSSSSQDFEESPEREVFGADDEQVFNNDPAQLNFRALVPAEVEDEIAGSVHFIDTFISRYGTNCPQFYSGTLSDALREACFRPLSERRLFAIYLHHDESVLSNIFCSEVLCFESIIETLSANFVLWGWDVTSDSARIMFYNSISELVGPSVVETVNKFSTDSYPLLIILTRPRRTVDLFNIISGNNNVNDLLSLLIHAVDVFSQIQQTEAKNQEERCLRENIKDEQDRAFEESLLADRAKDEAKRQREFLLREETERLKRQRQEEEEKREAERIAVESELPPEPADGSTGSIIKARFRTPSGEILHRKFLASHRLQILFNYLLVKGYRTAEYKVISGWPRKDLTILDPTITMTDLKLANQETFILEER